MGNISDKHLQTVCLRGGEESCAYLLLGGNGTECAKTYPFFTEIIDVRLADGEMRNKGDNCSGPPEFKLNFKLHIVKNDKTV